MKMLAGVLALCVAVPSAEMARLKSRPAEEATAGRHLSSVQTTVGLKADTAATIPELPRATVDISEPRQTARTIRVAGGGNLQAALNQAAGGDTIVLEAGQTFRGPFELPRKTGDGWVVI